MTYRTASKCKFIQIHPTWCTSPRSRVGSRINGKDEIRLS